MDAWCFGYALSAPHHAPPATPSSPASGVLFIQKLFDRGSFGLYNGIAGWSSLVARLVHTQEVVRSNRTLATNLIPALAGPSSVILLEPREGCTQKVWR